MITLTTEQAQHIEEALVATTLNKDYWLEKCMDSLDTIRAARAQEQAEPEQYPTYGFCPICGRRGISRERRINGNDTCANGHSYASNLALHIAPEKQAEQDSVAIISPNKANIVGINAPHTNIGTNGWIPLYTRPVRTKDLTGEEIERILTEQPNGEHMNLHWFYNAARAVIAADREKNK